MFGVEKILNRSDARVEALTPQPTSVRRGLQITGLALTALLLASCNLKEAQGAAQVRITYPADGTYIISARDRVEGTVSNLGTDERVWVLITDQGDRVYHPQDGPAEPMGQNGWRRIGVRFGDTTTDRLGKEYLISTVVADKKGDGKLREYMDRGDFRGLSQLPEGTRLQEHTVTVRRGNPQPS